MFDLKLKNGRSIHLDRFFASQTYAGLLEGKPNARLNEQLLGDRTYYPNKLWENIPNTTLGLDYYEKHLDLALPRFLCSGVFLSYTPAKNPEMHASQLVIVWYQEKVPPLIDDHNKAWLIDLPWETLAADFEW